MSLPAGIVNTGADYIYLFFLLPLFFMYLYNLKLRKQIWCVYLQRIDVHLKCDLYRNIANYAQKFRSLLVLSLKALILLLLQHSAAAAGVGQYINRKN